MIFWNQSWHPICGHYFWDNHIGASKFCEQLGCYSGGTAFPIWQLTDKEMRADNVSSLSYPVDSFRFGKCEDDDAWNKCQGGCNDNRLGGKCHTDEKASCQAGQPVRVKVTCSCSCTRNSSCIGILSIFILGVDKIIKFLNMKL